ncbi:signal peptidase I [Halocatena pleomorpha]|uniref:Signal peptidase I n=1 Tax=Halocatena pleomorpha TaxID=1785090 RepID=A0A3P3RFK0_9EURY|nr:signal peptidase I [Halocatena pleomorpha]RRJ31540.1 signal peptidase I [Halocatena pleomorpha]
MVQHRVGTVLQIVLVLAVVAITVGQFIGQPVLLAYVTSDSMEPTLSTGDGYLVLPSMVTDSAEEGDIIVFNAKTLSDENGGLTTHRVVEATDRGVVTQGDNNLFTDQDGGEPLVKSHQIVGKAIMIGDNPIVIPQLGTVFTGIREAVTNAQRSIAIALGTRSLLGTQGLSYLLFGVGILLYVGSVFAEDDGSRARRRNRKRKRKQTRRIPKLVIALALGGVLVASLTATMIVPGGMQELGVVSSEQGSGGPTIIASGQTEQFNYSVPNGGIVPVVTYLDPASEGVKTPDENIIVGPGDRQTVGIQLSAPEETGYYPRYVTEHRYLAILPPSWIDVLYRLHPWLPVIVIDAIVFGAFLTVAMSLLGRGHLRPRQSRSSLLRSIKRRLRF